MFRKHNDKSVKKGARAIKLYKKCYWNQRYSRA
jgi:hypothetical protein